MEPDRRTKLESFAWLTTLAMLLALFVPLASAGAQDAGEETATTGQAAEDGGTLDATPESATNKVDTAHLVNATATNQTDDGPEPEDGVKVVFAVDDPDDGSYDGGLQPGVTETCETDEDGACSVEFNDDSDLYPAPTSGKDRIRVFHDANDNDQWDDDEDFDFVTKTWVDVTGDDEAVRLWGETAENADRIQTANAVSQDHWADAGDLTDDREQAQSVVIARADDFPDALAGTPFAVLQEAPLLLTFPDSLDERTEDELQRVLDDEDGTVYLLGGNHALSQNVEQRIEELGYDVERLFGADRFDTAIDIAEEIETEQDDTLDHLFIARSHEFADALAGGAAAANISSFDEDAGDTEVGAILLTFHDQKEEDTEAFLAERDGVDDEGEPNDEPDATTYALGGPLFNPYSCAVDVEVADTWHTQSECANDDDAEDTADWAIFGADRQETSRAIAEFFFTDPSEVGIARGDKFPDALTGGAHIGQFGGPILLTQTGALDDDPKRYLCYTADTIDTAYIYGGVFAVAADTMDAVDDAIDGEDCPEFDVPGHWVGS